MVLLHETIQIVNESVPGVLRVLEVDPDVNGLHRAYLLAHPAEDATELVDLVHDGVPIPLVVFPADKTDAVGGADGGAQTAGHALRPTVGMNLHAMRSPPTRGEIRPFLGVLEGDLVGIYKMLEGQGHSLEGGT